jgi:hypothetical protein
MVEVSIYGESLILYIKGMDKFWAFKNKLSISLVNVKDVHIDKEIAKEWDKGQKVYGAEIHNVITAGTFYKGGKWLFWDVHNPEQSIVIVLENEKYDKLIVEVENPDNVVELITNWKLKRLKPLSQE